MSRRHQHVQFHRARAASPRIFDVDEMRARGPRKIDYVLGMKCQRLRAVAVVFAGDQIAARADDFIHRDSDAHVVRAEVRKKFRGGMKLMAIPRVLPPHADLRKPLAHHKEIAFVARALDHFGKLVAKRHAELHRCAGRNGLGQRHLHHGVVVGIVIVGLNELHFAGQIAHALDFEFRNGNRAVMFWIPARAGASAARTGQTYFRHECGLGLKRV